MKFKILIPVFCLCALAAFGQSYPVTSIMNNGADDTRINLVIMGDGYTAAEQANFVLDAQAVSSDMFSQVPFSNYAAFFNAYAIEVPSAESGADHPGTATDVSEPQHPVSTVNTEFNTTFDYFNIHRLLVATNSGAVFNVLNNNFPNYDQSLVISNTPYYGGSGGGIPVFSVHASAAEIAIHEIGHSFAGLSDEYWAGDFYAGENYNMTQETNPALVRWGNWYGEEGIGIYQHSGGGSASSWYRPHQNCKMRSLGAPFCAVCRERIIDVIYGLVSPVASVTPSNDGVYNMTNTFQVFNADLIYPNPNTLSVRWELNGEMLATGTASVTLDDSSLFIGANTLTLTVVDETTLSRSFWPEQGYRFSETWQIEYSPGPCPGQMLISNSPVPENVYHAAINLTSDAALMNGAIIEFKAGTDIDLLPPFEVPLGTNFTATIEVCN